MQIDGIEIGEGHPTYIVAELSANHGGRLETALASLDAAKACGAQAVKLQHYTPDALTLDLPDRPEYRIDEGPWAGRTLYDLYAEAALPWEWTPELFRHAREIGITLFSTPFDEAAVDFLERFDPPAYKVASFEITHLPLIRYIATTGKPMILSTGMATLAEISQAVRNAILHGAADVAIMHCSSAYPTKIQDARIANVRQIRRTVGGPVGFSDHTIGSKAACAAVALGASILEKHFKIESVSGPDAGFSADNVAMAQYICDVRETEAAVGDSAVFGPCIAEEYNMRFRRSVVAIRQIAEGEPFTEENVGIRRPNIGASPCALMWMLGRPSPRSYELGDGIEAV